MTRDEWLRQFDEELRVLRARPAEELVLKIAHAFHGDENPRAAAREYHQRINSAAAFDPPTPTNKPPSAQPS